MYFLPIQGQDPIHLALVEQLDGLNALRSNGGSWISTTSRAGIMMVYPLKMEMPTNNHTPGLSLEKDVSTGEMGSAAVQIIQAIQV